MSFLLQELPYHLEQLLDNNRLIRCLLEWPVFQRLFNEDFSVDLLRSWQKVTSSLGGMLLKPIEIGNMTGSSFQLKLTQLKPNENRKSCY